LVPATAKRHGTVKHFKGPDAEANAYLTGRFLMAAIGNDQKSKMWLQDHGVSMQHSSDDNSKGGYLVPEVLENALIDLKEEFGMFRRYAMNWPMTSDVSLVPRRVSGFTTYFVGQNDTITTSTTALDQVRLEAKKLAALTQYSSELNEDSIISVADYYAREFAYALAVREDQCGFLGDATSTFGGITGLSNLLIGTFQEAVGKLPEFPGIQPAWYVHKAVYHASMGRLQMAAGGNTVQDLGSGPVLQFLGYPVRFIQTLPSTASSGTKIAYFGDLAMAATMGTRRGVTLRADESLYFAQDALALRVTERFDINVHERGTASAAGPLLMIQMG
jgi:HK97 family phage major capsid protein